MKKLRIFFVLVPILAGCSFQHNETPNDTLSQNESICRDLKNNLTFNTTSSLNVNEALPTEEAEMMRLYNKYNCLRFEEQ